LAGLRTLGFDIIAVEPLGSAARTLISLFG
jgi:hypothetical protein